MNKYLSKQDLYLSLCLGLWVYLFLLFIAPFDAAPLNFNWRAKVMIGYAVVSLGSYLLTALVHNVFSKKLKSALTSEAVFNIGFILINFTPSYLYYKSDLIVGEYSFTDFTLQIYLASIIIVVPLIIIGRWAFNRSIPREQVNDKITYIGENKLDILQLEKSDLLIVQTASNYVEFHYLLEGEVRKKLIRSTLTKVHAEIPELVRVHRSYLVNLRHFSQWEDKKHILIHSLKTPVSDTYRSSLQDLLKTHP